MTMCLFDLKSKLLGISRENFIAGAAGVPRCAMPASRNPVPPLWGLWSHAKDSSIWRAVRWKNTEDDGARLQPILNKAFIRMLKLDPVRVVSLPAHIAVSRRE